MGDRDRKGINMIPEISMHMSEGVLKKKEGKKSAAIKLNKSADAAGSPEVGDGAAAGSNRQRQEES